MSTVALRRFRWWDVEPVMALERALFPDNPWSPETFWSELAEVPRTRYYLVAEKCGRVVGYAGLLTTRRQGDVQTLAVDHYRQRRGVGALLLRALLEEAERRGVAEVLLEVRAGNASARRLYERAGFERIGVRRGYYQPGNVDALVMRRPARPRPDDSIVDRGPLDR